MVTKIKWYAYGSKSTNSYVYLEDCVRYPNGAKSSLYSHLGNHRIDFTDNVYNILMDLINSGDSSNLTIAYKIIENNGNNS